VVCLKGSLSVLQLLALSLFFLSAGECEAPERVHFKKKNKHATQLEGQDEQGQDQERHAHTRVAQSVWLQGAQSQQCAV